MQVAATNESPSRYEPLVNRAQSAVDAAKDALSQGNIDEAVTVLNSLASQSAAFDIRFPAYLRTELWRLLRNHGIANGPEGLRAAEKMLETGVGGLPEDAPRMLRHSAERNLSLLRALIALQIPKSEELDHILASTSETVAGVTWATAKLQMGALRLEQGLLAEAEDDLLASLRVFTTEKHQDQWVRVHQQLASVYTAQQEPAKASDALRTALSILTEEWEPEDWAATQSRLGDSIMDECEALGEQADIWALVKAIAAYRDAMRIYQRGTRPGDWASIQERLSHVELALADHPSSGIVRPHLRAALHHVKNALSAYNGEAMTDQTHIARLSALSIRIEDRLSSGVFPSASSLEQAT